MIEELNSHYSEFKEVLDVLPNNTKINIKKKLIYIDEEYKSDNDKLELVKKEIEKRLSKFDNLKQNQMIDKIEKEIEKCNIMNEWNNYNTAYEKMHLDYYLYKLHRYYKDDLLSMNNCIKKIIESFKRVDIILTKEDFDFSDEASIYIDKVINNVTDEELKTCFEEVYWKNADIIKTIEINFKSIYLKNEKKINKYYENRHQEFLKNHKDSEINDIRISLNKKLNEVLQRDQYINFQKFVNNEYLLSDYKKTEIDKKIGIYFENDSYSGYYLNELYKVLNEYNILIKYKYLFDDMKTKLQSKDTLKSSKTNALKNIQKDENTLKKLAKEKNKKSLFGKKKNDDKWLFKYKEVLNNVIKEYDEFDNSLFEDLVFNKLKEDSKIEEILRLITSNYLYFVNKTYEQDDTKSINDITNLFEDLKNYTNNNEFILLNNVALLDEKQMKELIVNKYNLEHINITIDSLIPDNIEKTISDLKTIINYENIIASGINIDDISLYLDYKKMNS